MGRKKRKEGRKKGREMEVAAKNNFGVGFGVWTPERRGTRTITLDSDMAAAAISHGANAVILG